jgi:hypothetical protein
MPSIAGDAMKAPGPAGLGGGTLGATAVSDQVRKQVADVLDLIVVQLELLIRRVRPPTDVPDEHEALESQDEVVQLTEALPCRWVVSGHRSLLRWRLP